MSYHTTTDGHTSAIREQENKKAIAADLTVAPRKGVQETPTYSAIGGFKRMGETKKTVLKKLFNIAHHIAVKRRPFTESNFNLVRMKMRAVVRISSKPSLNSFFKKIYTRNFY